MPGTVVADLTNSVVTPTGSGASVSMATVAASALAGGNLTLSQLTTVVAALPTSLPSTSGVLWLNGGLLQFS